MNRKPIHTFFGDAMKSKQYCPDCNKPMDKCKCDEKMVKPTSKQGKKNVTSPKRKGK